MLGNSKSNHDGAQGIFKRKADGSNLNDVARQDDPPSDPALRKNFDKAVFTVLDGLATLRTVALVGDLNLLWESTGKGFHGELRERWKNRLRERGFGEPLDRLLDGGIVPTHRAYPRDAGNEPPDARVEFMLVRESLAFTRYSITPTLSCTSQSSLYCPLHLHCSHDCNSIARLMRDTRSPTDPTFLCHTPYNSGDGSIV